MYKVSKAPFLSLFVEKSSTYTYMHFRYITLHSSMCATVYTYIEYNNIQPVVADSVADVAAVGVTQI